MTSIQQRTDSKVKETSVGLSYTYATLHILGHRKGAKATRQMANLADKVAPHDNNLPMIDADEPKILKMPADAKCHPDRRRDVPQKL